MQAIPTEIDPGAKVEVRFSDDRRHFYLPGYAGTRGFWLTSVPIAEAPENPETTGFGSLKNWVQITPNGRQPYWREMLPFAFWKVRSYDHIEEEVPMDDDRVLDYFHLLSKQRR